MGGGNHKNKTNKITPTNSVKVRQDFLILGIGRDGKEIGILMYWPTKLILCYKPKLNETQEANDGLRYIM